MARSRVAWPHALHDKQQQQQQRENSRREQIWVFCQPVLGGGDRSVVMGLSWKWMGLLFLRWIHLSIELFKVYCLWPEWRNREWKTIYRLRFVLDGLRSLFRLVVLKCVFHVQIKQSCRSGKLVVFFWCRQDQKGTGGTEIYILETRVRRCALRNAFLMYWSS